MEERQVMEADYEKGDGRRKGFYLEKTWEMPSLMVEEDQLVMASFC